MQNQQISSFVNGIIVENYGLMNFVSNLGEVNKAQNKWSEQPTELRSEALKDLLDLISEKSDLGKKLSLAQQLPENFVLQADLLRAIQKLSSSLELFSKLQPGSRAPLGTVVVVPPVRLGFSYLIEVLTSALLMGNAVTVIFPKESPESCRVFIEVIQNWFQRTNESLLPRALIQIVSCFDEVKEVIMAHPSVKAVAFQGKHTEAAQMIKLTQASNKKVSVMAGYHNSALVLPDADLNQAAEKLVQSVFIGSGCLRWNMNQILITDAQSAEFEKIFVEKLNHQRDLAIAKKESVFHPHFSDEAMENEKIYLRLQEELYGDIQTELNNGDKKIVWKADFPDLNLRPRVIKELTHCSTLQQDFLGAPIVFISTVKYVHEMARWANLGYLNQAVQIFGSTEKALKMAHKINVGVVFINSWVESLTGSEFGARQSSYGITDLTVSSSLFGDAKNLTLPKSNS